LHGLSDSEWKFGPEELLESSGGSVRVFSKAARYTVMREYIRGAY